MNELGDINDGGFGSRSSAHIATIFHSASFNMLQHYSEYENDETLDRYRVYGHFTEKSSRSSIG